MSKPAISAVASEAQQQPQPKVRGRPFAPGTTGNPGGLQSNGKAYRQMYDALEADLGGSLTAVQRLQLDQVVGLVLLSRRVKDAAARVKLANASARLLSTLTSKRTSPPPIPLRDQLAREFAND